MPRINYFVWPSPALEEETVVYAANADRIIANRDRFISYEKLIVNTIAGTFCIECVYPGHDFLDPAPNNEARNIWDRSRQI